jgi:hypothetical protein
MLTLLAQILRTNGTKLHAELSPATDQPRIVRALEELLDLPALPSAGNVVAFDLQCLSVDLSTVPLDEVLAFRKEQPNNTGNTFVLSGNLLVKSACYPKRIGSRRLRIANPN